MARINRENTAPTVATRKRGRPARPPSARNCEIYERVRLEGQNQEKVAAEHAVSRQRIAEIVAQVETWVAQHPRHELAQKMRVRCGSRWEALWSESMASFARSREDREIKKERTARRKPAVEGDEAPLMTVTEHTIRQQNGDPRFLNIARRVADREDRLWMRDEEVGRASQVASPPAETGDLGTSPDVAASLRFPYLPARLCDLEHLACGLSNDALTPVSILFEQRCADAFRCLGFDVRELGQGCGRVADCLAVATAERFAVVIDAKVRRRGYTLATDDRQFCEYATRHTRELANSGIERVYFAVIGHGFRQQDLDKLAGFMTGTPIRSVAFIEAEALMRLVNESICKRREFRLADVDRLLFGNKIIEN